MKHELGTTSVQEKDSILDFPLDWVPNTEHEKAPENHERDDNVVEIKETVSHLSPEMQVEMRELSTSQEPRKTEENLLNYVVTEDHFGQLRKDSRLGDFKKEGRIHDLIYWIAMFPVLLVLYVIFSWLSYGNDLGH